ncbi:hypothetical protein FKP32DRAFT_510480 [Trametes sanguinea]|nr:hypothetical protein FKP32DRAFT_510480 [Trametes sanguinea]
MYSHHRTHITARSIPSDPMLICKSLPESGDARVYASTRSGPAFDISCIPASLSNLHTQVPATHAGMQPPRHDSFRIVLKFCSCRINDSVRAMMHHWGRGHIQCSRLRFRWFRQLMPTLAKPFNSGRADHCISVWTSRQGLGMSQACRTTHRTLYGRRSLVLGGEHQLCMMPFTSVFKAKGTKTHTKRLSKHVRNLDQHNDRFAAHASVLPAQLRRHSSVNSTCPLVGRPWFTIFIRPSIHHETPPGRCAISPCHPQPVHVPVHPAGEPAKSRQPTPR